MNKKLKGASRIALLVLMTAIFLGAGITIYWFEFRTVESTEDAYVQAHVSLVSSRVPGTVQEIFVDNDDFVHQGEVLFSLDPIDYELQVKLLEAGLQGLDAKIGAASLQVEILDKQTQAKLEGAKARVKAAQEKKKQVSHLIEQLSEQKKSLQADLEQTKRDLRRFKGLYQTGSTPKQTLDKYQTAFAKFSAGLKAIEAQIHGAQANLQGAIQGVLQARAGLAAALAERSQVQRAKYELAGLRAERKRTEVQLQLARLNVGYCQVRASISGLVAQRHVQKGNRLQAGQPVMAIVPLQDVYIQANFKETQLEDIRLGQPVKIWADSYPGHMFEGVVQGIRAGTGTAFSLLPPENASGNWIKVVQRIPVKIRLVQPPPVEFPLRIGMSVKVEVDTSDQSGPRLQKKDKLDGRSQFTP